jgi:hypothetical protein
MAMENSEETHTGEAYDTYKAVMRQKMAEAITTAEAAYKDHRPVRQLWNEAVAVWEEFQDIAHGILDKERSSQAEDAEMRVQDWNKEVDYFEQTQLRVRKRIRSLRKKDNNDEIKRIEAAAQYQGRLSLKRGNQRLQFKARPN